MGREISVMLVGPADGLNEKDMEFGYRLLQEKAWKQGVKLGGTGLHPERHGDRIFYVFSGEARLEKHVAVYYGKPFSRMVEEEKAASVEELKAFALHDGFFKVEHVHFEDVELDGLAQTEISGLASLHYTEVP